MQSLIVVSMILTYCMADIPSVHDKPITVNVVNGGRLSLRVPKPVNIWHRKFDDDSDDTRQYVEACNEFIDICDKWRAGAFGINEIPIKVTIAKDGTLMMPRVTSADTAQYYTYYMAEDGVYHYVYFNVNVGTGSKRG